MSMKYKDEFEKDLFLEKLNLVEIFLHRERRELFQILQKNQRTVDISECDKEITFGVRQLILT